DYSSIACTFGLVLSLSALLGSLGDRPYTDLALPAQTPPVGQVSRRLRRPPSLFRFGTAPVLPNRLKRRHTCGGNGNAGMDEDKRGGERRRFERATAELAAEGGSGGPEATTSEADLMVE